MLDRNPYSIYLENQVRTASPGGLLLITYDAAIRFGRLAQQKMGEKKLDEQSANIRKVQEVLLELMNSLNAKANPVLAESLDGLYTYMFDTLTHANINDDAEALEEVIQILIDLRSAWAQAELTSRTGIMQEEQAA
ncbi:MAG: flagellar export chaperone FliS [Armatimonadota bacterium]